MIAQPPKPVPDEEILDPPVELVDAVREKFRSKLESLIDNALEAPSTHDDRIDDLLANLIQINAERPQPTFDAARQALEAARNESHTYRCQQLARDIHNVAAKLGIPLEIISGSQSKKVAKRPRLTSAKRQELGRQLLALLADHPAKGLSKAQLSQQLGITINQTKRLLLSPEVQGKVLLVGYGADSRYLATLPEAPEASPHHESLDEVDVK